jgi:hypothetical protein
MMTLLPSVNIVSNDKLFIVTLSLLMWILKSAYPKIDPW